MKKKNPHAVALGRMGGTANTPSQHKARVANGSKSQGRPRIHPRGATSILRYHLKQIKQQGGEVRTPKQQAALDLYTRLQKEQSR